MLVLDANAVRRLLPFPVAIIAMREVMRAFSTGEVTQPVRLVLKPPPPGGPHGVFGAMPAHIPADGRHWYGIKSVVVKADNPRRGLHTHVGTVTVFDPENGLPLAVMDASTVTEIRTAAVSALATDLLARPDASRLAIIGAGHQARPHLEAMLAVRPIKEVRVWNRTRAAADALAAWAAKAHGLSATACATVREATLGAEVICTVTAAKEPLVGLADVSPGAHINGVGACQPGARELDSELIAASAVYLDSREAARTEATELLVPIAEKKIDANHPRGELGELLAGRCPGRKSADERTVYCSLGIAAQDVAAGVAVARRAKEEGGGTSIGFP